MRISIFRWKAGQQRLCNESKNAVFCCLDALQNLVGQQNARYGIIRIFNALQETSANRHLLYILLEMLLKELYPELSVEAVQA
ncbi:sorting nexin-25-like [Sinocyclocheilus grahami]|uniref:sorting nexin-25-like n=1 Tax=Sinocyclocheilus grahami TaxID=75366 RepID=UPI0007AC99C7|nr:PREDICTED: sorting nexin-25-like [Sinocyclocheilus grahami]